MFALKFLPCCLLTIFMVAILVPRLQAFTLQTDGDLDERNEEECFENTTSYEIVGLDWFEVHVPYTIIVWVMIASGIKVGK